MRPDRDVDWKPRVASLAQQKVRERKTELQVARRMALSADYVTGDEHWDMLLSVIQERLESKRKLVAETLLSLEKSDDFSPDVMINQKLAVRLLGKEIDILEWVMGLPNDLKEQGDRADELLGTIDESSD